jgi:hypothetical protein
MDTVNTTNFNFNTFNALESDSDSDSEKSIEEITMEEISEVPSKEEYPSVLDPSDTYGWTTVSRKSRKSREPREVSSVTREKYQRKKFDRYEDKDEKEPLSDIIASIDKKNLVDKELQCKDCQEDFNFIVKQQHYFLINRWNDPTRCYKCRKQKKQDRALERSINISENNEEDSDTFIIIDEEDFLNDENIIVVP